MILSDFLVSISKDTKIVGPQPTPRLISYSTGRKLQIADNTFTLTVIAIGCPTATSFEPSGASILARYLVPTTPMQI